MGVERPDQALIPSSGLLEGWEMGRVEPAG